MKNKYDSIRLLSIIVIAVITVVNAGSKMAGIVLSDTIVRLMGVLNMVFLVAFIYATVRKIWG